jgi:tRNA-2-methylthio-N6-dimethylallyladenosine synthase
VLIEARDRGRWRGRTRTNKIVYFDHPGGAPGDVVDVEIGWTGPWSMVGTTAAARDRAPREALSLTPA